MSLERGLQQTLKGSRGFSGKRQPPPPYPIVALIVLLCLLYATGWADVSMLARDPERPASLQPGSLHGSVAADRNNDGGTSNPRAPVISSQKGRLMLAQSLRDVTDEEYRVATFISAARDGEIEAVKKFLDEGMDVNAKNKSGNTALMEACGTGQEDVISLLLDKGADAKAKNNIGETAASKAIKNRKFNALVVLRKRDVWKLDAEDAVEILRYAEADFIKSWFSQLSQENQKGILNWLPRACESGKVEVVRFLLENGADPNQHKGLPLKICSSSSGPPLEAIKLLLDKGANPNLWEKESPLHFAASSARPDVVKLMLEKGADVNARNEKGNTALMECLGSPGQHSLDPVVKALLEKGANANDKDKNGFSALMYAALTARIEAVKMLLDKGADINARNEKGTTALLECLARPGQYSLDPVVKVLLEKGANANDKDRDNISALMYAAFTGRIEAVKMLLDKGADINHRTPKGGSPLGAAIKGEHKEIVTLLKKRGARQ